MIHNSPTVQVLSFRALSPEKAERNATHNILFTCYLLWTFFLFACPFFPWRWLSKILWYGQACRLKLTQSSILHLYTVEIELQTSYWQFNSKPPRERLFVFCCCLGSWICYNQTSEINKHDPIENVPVLVQDTPRLRRKVVYMTT